MAEEGVGLERIHLCVAASLDTHQFVVAALLHDAASVEENDFVGHANR